MSLRQDIARLASEQPQLRKHLLPLLRQATGFNNKAKAKPGDLIQSFNVGNPPSTMYPSFIGRVKKVAVDDQDGVEYVYYEAIVELRDKKPAANPRRPMMRVPQNGTPTDLGKTTDYIHII